MQRLGRHLAERPWIPVFILLFGWTSVALLVFNDQIRQRSAVEDAFALRACEQIRVDIAISHLWLEEYVSGDDVDLQEIRPRLDDAIRRLDQMTGTVLSAPSATDTLAAPPLHDEALLQSAAGIRPLLDTFATLSEERQQGFAKNLPVGIGSALDIEYDEVFGDLLRTTQQLAEDLELHSRQHRRRTQRLFWTIVILWSLLVSLAAFGLWARQRRQQRAEKALQESRDQLTHSQRMDAAGRLAGGLAHDLSNYLAAIRGHCELTRLKTPEGPRLVRKMDEVIQTVDRASHLVDNLLAFGRRQPVRPAAVDLRRVVPSVVQMLSPSLGDQVEMELHLPETLWPALLDRAGFEQVLVNLVVNARDAMADGGKILIAAHNRPAGDGLGVDELEMIVTDQGSGIAQEHLDSIFEPFWTTKRTSGGSGLGLSMVYGWVQQNGGRISVESRVDEGTTFRIFLPRTEDAASRPSPERRAADEGDSPTTPRKTFEDDLADDALGLLEDGDLEGSETLLLVDDNLELRRSIQEVLEALGYRVHGASNGQRAQELALRHTFDIWIIDLVLPDIDGRRLLEELRRHDHLQPTPVILISGHHPQELAKNGAPWPSYEDVATLFLSKRDLSAFRLAQRIRQILDGVETDDD